MLKKCIVVVVAGGMALFVLMSQAKSAYFDEGGLLVMKNAAHKTQLYRLLNTGSQSIHLDVEAKPVGVQAGYATILDPNHESAFIYNGTKPPMVWQCQISADASAALQKIACDKVLKVSVVRSKKLKLGSDAANHWLIENKPQADFKGLLQTTLTNNHLMNEH